MSTLSASNHRDLTALRIRVFKLKRPEQIDFLASMLAFDLMRTQHSWWVRIMALGRKHRIATIWQRLFRKREEAFYETMSGTMHHLLYGYDTEEIHSVGGFSQRELDVVAAIVSELERRYA
jgi:hypothetical protein